MTAAGAAASNYPFCTIDPNVGVVTVPDDRLYVLQNGSPAGGPLAFSSAGVIAWPNTSLHPCFAFHLEWSTSETGFS